MTDAKPIRFTAFKSPEPLSKHFTLADDGRMVKTPAANMTEGRARRLAVDFSQFGAALGRAGACVAFGYGLHDVATFGETVKIAIAAKADPAKKVLARTRKFFDYRPEPGVLMIDHDPHADGPTISPEALRGILAEIFPGFAGAAVWVRGSLSAGVHPEGEAPKPGRGFHLYFAVADAADIPRFGKLLFDRLWLAGHGFIALSAAGTYLVRAVIDGAVFDGERLDFVGQPVVGPGLAYTPPQAVYLDGGYLDTQALPDLTDAEQRQLATLIDQAKQAREPDRQAIRAQWEERHAQAMVERGVPKERARAQLRMPPDGRRFDLYRDFPLVFAQRGFASVGDVLANPAQYDGEACADPFEGVEYGRTTAKFFANAREGKPFVNSQAHGGMKYFLHAGDGQAVGGPEPRPEEPPFDPAYYAQFASQDEDDGQIGVKAAKPTAKSRKATAAATSPARPPHSHNARAHAPASKPSHPAQPTQCANSQPFGLNSNLHPSCTDLHPSYTDRLNEYAVAEGVLLEADKKNGTQTVVAESRAAEIVARLIGRRFRYHAQAGVWHRYDLNHWAPVAEAEVFPHVSAILTNGTAEEGYKQTYLNGVMVMLKRADLLPLPPAQPGKIPFTNGLFDMVTRTLEPLTQDNALTWVIPHPFVEKADCPRFRAWLKKAIGDAPGLVEFLRAFIAACLTGRADLQKFLMLLGPGGTGKGTFLRLLTEILGRANCTTTDLKNLEQNRFETAALYGKRLASISDAGRYVGSVDTLKAITGQDELRREEKHRQQGGTFIYEGMVLIASNEQLATTDYTSGLERRLLVVKFTRRFSPEEKAAFIECQGEAALRAEIPAIIQWALELQPEDVTRLFMHPPQAVADAALEALTEQNPVVEWIREHLIADPHAWTAIGVRGEKRDHGVVTYTDSDCKLYPNYLHFCYQSKREALGLNRFRNTVVDMLGTLKIPAHSKRKNSAQGIVGVKIRPDGDFVQDAPTPPGQPTPPEATEGADCAGRVGCAEQNLPSNSGVYREVF